MILLRGREVSIVQNPCLPHSSRGFLIFHLDSVFRSHQLVLDEELLALGSCQLRQLAECHSHSLARWDSHVSLDCVHSLEQVFVDRVHSLERGMSRALVGGVGVPWVESFHFCAPLSFQRVNAFACRAFFAASERWCFLGPADR